MMSYPIARSVQVISDVQKYYEAKEPTAFGCYSLIHSLSETCKQLLQAFLMSSKCPQLFLFSHDELFSIGRLSNMAAFLGCQVKLKEHPNLKDPLKVAFICVLHSACFEECIKCILCILKSHKHNSLHTFQFTKKELA